MSPQPLPHAAAASMEKHLKGAFPYTRQRRAAAAAATYITLYGIIISGLLPYGYVITIGR